MSAEHIGTKSLKEKKKSLKDEKGQWQCGHCN